MTLRPRSVCRSPAQAMAKSRNRYAKEAAATTGADMLRPILVMLAPLHRQCQQQDHGAPGAEDGKVQDRPAEQGAGGAEGVKEGRVEQNERKQEQRDQAFATGRPVAP